jgi:hypothetical protein
VPALPGEPPAYAASRPTADVTPREGGAGGRVTVTGRGWKPHALLTLLVCGQNAIGGTGSCANSTGKAATTDARGRLSVRLPVAEPPKPCPCVVHIATVTGAEPAVVDVPFTVAGHPVAPLPERGGTSARLAALGVRLEGSNGFLNWFGAPAHRTLVVTVGNMGSAPARNPAFRVGTAHSVYAPRWEEVRWEGTIASGGRQDIRFPVELAMGAHGDYKVSLEYGGRLLAVKTWTAPRPWGATLFWVLLFTVVPAGIFRIGLEVVNRFNTHGNANGKGRRTGRGKGNDRPHSRDNGNGKGDRNGTGPAATTEGEAAALPWFAPDTLPATSNRRKGST